MVAGAGVGIPRADVTATPSHALEHQPVEVDGEMHDGPAARHLRRAPKWSARKRVKAPRVVRAVLVTLAAHDRVPPPLGQPVDEVDRRIAAISNAMTPRSAGIGKHLSGASKRAD